MSVYVDGNLVSSVSHSSASRTVIDDSWTWELRLPRAQRILLTATIAGYGTFSSFVDVEFPFEGLGSYSHLTTANGRDYLLRDVDLRFGEVRLMQITTNSIIAGSTVASLMVGAEKFKPNDIDICAPLEYDYYIVRFLRMGGNYAVKKVDNSSGGHQKKKKSVINVMESLTVNHFDCVLHFHLTSVFGAWTGLELSHGYLGQTFAGHAMATSATLPLINKLGNLKQVWKTLQKYKHEGFGSV
ncbi:hypothetical protein B0H19DRAFT_1270036 [Mycena capillaripes]|nr:hypothetical protein B0H19DRAFT_1270036 [Mycena capillaripes]